MAKITLIKTFDNSYRLYRLLGLDSHYLQNYKRAVNMFKDFKTMVFFPEQLFLVDCNGETYNGKKLRSAYQVFFTFDIHGGKSRVETLNYYSYMHEMRHYTNPTRIASLPIVMNTHLACVKKHGICGHAENPIGMFNFLPMNCFLNDQKKLPLRNMGALFLDKDEAIAYTNHVLDRTTLTDTDAYYEG